MDVVAYSIASIACLAALLSTSSLAWGVALYLLSIHFMGMWLEAIDQFYMAPYGFYAIVFDVVFLQWIIFNQPRKGCSLSVFFMPVLCVCSATYSLACVWEVGEGLFYRYHQEVMLSIAFCMASMGVSDALSNRLHLRDLLDSVPPVRNTHHRGKH